MNNTKFKILAAIDAVLIVGLMVLMFVLKGKYNDQAQASVKEQKNAYMTTVSDALQAQLFSVDQFCMAWKLVHATLTGPKTEAAFDANVAKIFEDTNARQMQISTIYSAAGVNNKSINLTEEFLLKNEGGEKEVACGKNCVIKFSFAKGKLKEMDYNALVEYKMEDNIKLEAPAAFHFE